MSKALNWKVAGSAGEGIMTTGLLFSKTCARHGLSIFDYMEYPSLIRGGHNTYQVHASTDPVTSQKKSLDVLVALNQNALNFHVDELTDKSLILYDKEDDNIDINKFNLSGKTFDLPMVRLAKESGGSRVMANNVALGASIFFLKLDLKILDQVIADIFASKGDKIIDANHKAALAGYNFAKQKSKSHLTISKGLLKNQLTLTGNEAISLGAIAGGLQFYVAYPMTPSSSILHYLAAVSSKSGFVVKHAEDEVGAVNMALGASFAGTRTMIGTSGGGFAYMTEALGLAGVAELPLVIVEVMRPGPALGMPTWTAQGDLQFVLTASQDEFPRFVLAPGDGQEAFDLTFKALELAEKYQTLVILISDKYLSESRHTIELKKYTFKNKRFGFTNSPKADATNFFPRYLPTNTGISQRSIPGQKGGIHIANSYEHDQYGVGIEEAEVRVEQMDKRNKKFESMKSEIPNQLYTTQNNSKLTFISFGSTKGPIASARKQLTQQGISTNMLHLSWLWPFPTKQVESILTSSPKTLIIEGNSYGQLANLITQETGIKLNNHLRRYDGRPFYSEDITDHVNKIL